MHGTLPHIRGARHAGGLRHPRSAGIALTAFALLLACARAADGASGGDAPAARDQDAPPPRIAVSGAGQGYRGVVGVPAAGNGDDGDLVRGRLPALEAALVLTPTTQAENVVLDGNTGLMWIRSLSALDGTDGVGARGNLRLDEGMYWQEALEAARALDYAGHDDWRLPTVQELDSILDFGRSEPALDPIAFPEPYARLPSPYAWTSTTSPVAAREAYYVNLRDGHRHPWGKLSAFAVRPVRRAKAPGDGTGFQAAVAVLRSGQTEGYVGNLGGAGSGNGDDGDLRTGEARDYAWTDDGHIDAPAENLVRDRATGLTWLRVPSLLDGLGGPAELRGATRLSEAMDWQTAVERCRALDYAGHTDWRLPSIRELDSLVQPGRPGAPLDAAAFPPPAALGAPEARSWWSSTTAAYAVPPDRPADVAWYVRDALPPTRHHVVESDPPAKGHLRHARCVRDDHRPAPPPEGYRHEIRRQSDYVDLAATLGRDRSEVKWLLDARATDEAGLPVDAAFQYTERFPLHLDLLRFAFPQAFAGLGPDDYTALAGRRATRTVYAGALRAWPGADGGLQFGWDVYTAQDDPSEAPKRAEVVDLQARLARVFRRRPLSYAPADEAQRDRALGWRDPRLPVLLPPPLGEDGYEAYTPGLAYGTVRVLPLAALAEAVEDGALGRQDLIVVPDGAPADLGQVVSAIVTGAPQGALSHLAVRAARRGTPNGYVDGAAEAFAPFDGRLVRLSLASDDWSVAPASAEEAEAHWASIRPEPVAIAPADRTYAALDALGTIGAEPGAATRVGGKAANLAALYTFLPEEHQVPGFAVPFAPFDRMLDVPAGRDAPPGAATLRGWVVALAEDPEMAAGPGRAARLDDLRDAIRDAAPPAELVAALAARIDEVFGPGVMVRFRSSSNAEDGLRFNGAGLYDSTSVCVADGRDGDERGPSRCDPNQPEERTIERGLGRVWKSLYTLRAWEERDWYGIDQREAAMAILVTPAFPDERANGVAFTGDPAAPEAPVMLVAAQAGDESVVSPAPGVLPERSRLTVEDGLVTGIQRIQASSLIPEGEVVLSDAELLALGELMLLAEARMPIDLDDAPGAAREDVMLDLELKMRRGDDALLIKQIRPFLPPESERGVRLFSPGPLALCGLWRVGEDLEAARRGRVEVDLGPGEARIPLDGAAGTVPDDLIAALRVDPERLPTTPVGPTEARVEAIPGRADLARVSLHRAFADAAGGTRSVEIALPAARRDRLTVRALDDAGLTEPLDLVVTASDAAEGDARRLGPCGLPRLPSERLTVHFLGGALRLDLRKADRPTEPFPWAALVGAELRLTGEGAVVDDPAWLAYTAKRHGWDERFRVDLAAPLGRAHAVELFWPTGPLPPEVTLLGPEDEPLGRRAVVAWLRQREVNHARTISLPSAFGRTLP